MFILRLQDNGVVRDSAVSVHDLQVLEMWECGSLGTGACLSLFLARTSGDAGHPLEPMVGLTPGFSLEWRCSPFQPLGQCHSCASKVPPPPAPLPCSTKAYAPCPPRPGGRGASEARRGWISRVCIPSLMLLVGVI